MGNDVGMIGAGGHAKVLLATLQAAGHRVVAAFDDDRSRWGTTILGVPIRGPVEEAFAAPYPLAIGIGSNATRRRIAEATEHAWATAIHPSAVVHSSVTIGPGTLVAAGTVLQPDTTVGAHTIINTGATVDHDGVIGDFAHICPGATLAGVVTVGAGTLVGTGAAVIPTVTIGAWASVGAGAVCIREVPDGAVVVGVPARAMGD